LRGRHPADALFVPASTFLGLLDTHLLVSVPHDRVITPLKRGVAGVNGCAAAVGREVPCVAELLDQFSRWLSECDALPKPVSGVKHAC
jgi:hypothetical protein